MDIAICERYPDHDIEYWHGCHGFRCKKCLLRFWSQEECKEGALALADDFRETVGCYLAEYPEQALYLSNELDKLSGAL